MLYKANAKINLRLKIVGKKNSGYHELQMLNAKIDLYDILKFNKTTDEIKVTINNDMPEENNFVYKIAKYMKEQYMFPGGLTINIEKNIPMSGGLGGGSSDAACTINAINNIYGLNLTFEEKTNIAMKFGTDIVYCLQDNIAIVEGTGEKITPINIKIPYKVILVNPNIAVSTKEIYQMVDAKKITGTVLTYDEFSGDSLINLMENDLQDYTISRYPIIAEIISELEELKVKKSIMSGSGASVIALVESEEAIEITKKYHELHPDYFVTLSQIIETR